jgi:hypothetical protein
MRGRPRGRRRLGAGQPVAARSSEWVRQANELCLPRDRVIRKLQLAAEPVFFSPAVVAKIDSEAGELRRIGTFGRIPLLAYKWRIAAHALREGSDPVRIDQHLIVAHRVAEEYGIHCRLGAIPLSRIPGS